MSRTDKDRPHWVQMNDPSLSHIHYVKHDHRFGYCDFDEYTGKKFVGRDWTWCDRDWGYNWNKLFSRRYSYFDNIRERKERARIRIALQEVRKLGCDDVEDVDIICVQHRHSADWDRW